MLNRFSAFLSEKAGEARRDITLLAISLSCVALQMLWHFPLLEPDEGRYSEIPREMLEKMDFITPTLNYVKYFEKPPLLYWMNALSFSAFGQNEFAARLPCAVSGVLTVIFVYWMGRKLFGRRAGIAAAVVLGSSIGFLPMSRINLTDVPLTLFMTVSLGAFILAVRGTAAEKPRYYYLSYAAAAMAVLAKGLIGIVFPAAIIFLFILFRKRWDILLEMRIPSGLMLFLLIASPWFILVSLKNPEFARFFFIHEHFERFTTKVHGRYQPFWYFIPLIAGIMLPWIFFLPKAMKTAWQERRGENGETYIWLIIWWLFIFLFFSKSNSKLPHYIAPALPAIALLIGSWFDREEPTGSVFRSRFITRAAIISTLISITATFIVYTNLAPRKSSKPMALQIKELAKPDDMIASFGYDQSLPFYSGRRTVVVGGMGELEFGSKQGDQSDWFIQQEKLVQAWSGNRRIFLLLGKGDYQQLATVLKPAPTVISETKKRVVITNR